MKKAIVIGYGVSSLGVIRSLGLKGFQITAMYCDKADFSHTSKYVYERVKIPHPRIEEREFIGILIKNSYKWEGSLIFDTDDNVAVSISKNKPELTKYYKIVTPEWGILRKFIEKKETYRIAERCNVPYPKTLLPKTLDELHEIKEKIDYHCILKPVLGHEFISEFKSKNFKADNYDELHSKFNLCLKWGQEVMIQEIIPGPASNMYNYTVYINSESCISARFLRIKVRQDPPEFGITRVGISKNRVLEVEEFAEKLLKNLSLKGLLLPSIRRIQEMTSSNYWKLMQER